MKCTFLFFLLLYIASLREGEQAASPCDPQTTNSASIESEMTPGNRQTIKPSFISLAPTPAVTEMSTSVECPTTQPPTISPPPTPTADQKTTGSDCPTTQPPTMPPTRPIPTTSAPPGGGGSKELKLKKCKPPKKKNGAKDNSLWDFWKKCYDLKPNIQTSQCETDGADCVDIGKDEKLYRGKCKQENKKELRHVRCKGCPWIKAEVEYPVCTCNPL